MSGAVDICHRSMWIIQQMLILYIVIYSQVSLTPQKMSLSELKTMPMVTKQSADQWLYYN